MTLVAKNPMAAALVSDASGRIVHTMEAAPDTCEILSKIVVACCMPEQLGPLRLKLWQSVEIDWKLSATIGSASEMPTSLASVA